MEHLWKPYKVMSFVPLAPCGRRQNKQKTNEVSFCRFSTCIRLPNDLLQLMCYQRHLLRLDFIRHFDVVMLRVWLSYSQLFSLSIDQCVIPYFIIQCFDVVIVNQIELIYTAVCMYDVCLMFTFKAGLCWCNG